MRAYLYLILALLSNLVIFAPLQLSLAEELSPKALIEDKITKARNFIVENKGKIAREDLEKTLKDIVYPAFDFKKMSRLSLGNHWKKGTKEEQKKFVTLFSELLGENYIDTVIDGIDKYEVTFEKERVRGKKAIVKTLIIQDDNITVDYRLYNKKGKWQVYDVIIENIGLVSNYRNEFAGIIRKESFAGLIKQTQEKIDRRREKKED